MPDKPKTSDQNTSDRNPESTIDKSLVSALKSSKAFLQEYGAALRMKFDVNAKLRKGKEDEWLAALRQYKGIYEPEVAANIDKNASKVYPKITRAKVKKLLSRLRQILFPRTELSWNIEPTPNPTLPPEIEEQIISELIEAAQIAQQESQQEGQPIKMPSGQEVLAAVMKYANMTSDAMKTEINDQLTEMKYEDDVAYETLRSGVMYGTGIAKGPLAVKRKIKSYELDDNGQFQPKISSIDLPDISLVPIWSFYPDMTSQSLDGCEWIFERHIMNKDSVGRLASRPDFDGDTIKEYLRAHPDGDAKYLEWEQALITLDAESTGLTMTRVDGTVISHSGTRAPRGRRYELIECWGILDARELQEKGIQIKDETETVEINVWLLNNVPIKVVKNDLPFAERPYKLFYFEKDESSIFGDGLPKVMNHSQSAMASSSRMILDNGAICSGPQLEVNIELLDPECDYSGMHSRKIWTREGTGADAQYPAIRNVQVDSHITELIAIFNLFREIGNEESAFPEWMASEAMNKNETVGAMSMRLGSLNVSILDIAKNFDTFTESVIKSMYAWNMDFNDKQYIKGDYTASARGSASLVMKEVRMQALVQLKSVMDPEDWTWIKRPEWIREIFKAHDLPSIMVRTEDEREQHIAQIVDEKLRQLQYAQMEAEIEYRKAAALHMATKARNVDKETETMPDSASEGPTDLDLLLASEDQRRKDEKHRLELIKGASDITSKATISNLQARAIDTKTADSSLLTHAKVVTEAERAADVVERSRKNGRKRAESKKR